MKNDVADNKPYVVWKGNNYMEIYDFCGDCVQTFDGTLYLVHNDYHLEPIRIGDCIARLANDVFVRTTDRKRARKHRFFLVVKLILIVLIEIALMWLISLIKR